MKKWRFGIVGAGLIARFHAMAIGALESAEVAGFCDSGSGRARDLVGEFGGRVFADYKELAASEGVDVVAIATPSGFHAEPAIEAARCGKHVICEKPLEVTLERIDMMIAAARDNEVLLGGIFQNRFTNAMMPLRAALRQGRFGKVTYAGAYVPWWRREEYYKDSWHGTWALDGGGAMMNQSIHMIDMLCDLMGPVRSVCGFVGRPGHPEIEAEDTGVAALEFASGAMGVIYGTTGSWPGRGKRFEVTGTDGTAVFLEDSFVVWKFRQETAEDEQVRQRFRMSRDKGGAADPGAIDFENHRRNFAAFLEALEGGGDFEISGAEARKAVEVILAIYRSARERRVVELGG